MQMTRRPSPTTLRMPSATARWSRTASPVISWLRSVARMMVLAHPTTVLAPSAASNLDLESSC
jgi:hypothetical protein